MKRCPLMGLLLSGGQSWGGGNWEEGDYWTFWKEGREDRLFGGGGVRGWRGDDFTGGGQLEGQVQHCSATT